MSDNKEVTIALPFEWTLKKVLGPVSDKIGEDIQSLYVIGRDKIINAAYRKIEDPDDQKVVNIRVARDVLWHGAFSDDEICAEYFGGILAASRSDDGQDDRSIEFVDTIKGLSSSQLKFHYMIYRGLYNLLSKAGDSVNVAQGREINARKIVFSGSELLNLGIHVDTDLSVLFRRGLLSEYKMDNDVSDGTPFYYVSAQPTTYGVLLYAAAHNQMKHWRDFAKRNFGEFKDIDVPRCIASTVGDVRRLVRVRMG